MTPYQEQIMAALKDGERLSYELSGVYFEHKKLKVETADALVDTGELVRIKVKGRYLQSDYLVHQSQLDNFLGFMKARKYEVLEVVSPFRF